MYDYIDSINFFTSFQNIWKHQKLKKDCVLPNSLAPVTVIPKVKTPSSGPPTTPNMERAAWSIPEPRASTTNVNATQVNP